MKFDERGFVIYEMMPCYNIVIPKSGQEKKRTQTERTRAKETQTLKPLIEVLHNSLIFRKLQKIERL